MQSAYDRGDRGGVAWGRVEGMTATGSKDRMLHDMKENSMNIRDYIGEGTEYDKLATKRNRRYFQRNRWHYQRNSFGNNENPARENPARKKILLPN